MLYDFKELHIITPVGLIQIEGKFSMSVYMQIESAFLCCNGNDDKENIICFLTIEQESERWMTIKSNEGSQKVYYRSVCDFLENSITNLIIRETKESDTMMLLHGAACVFQNKAIVIIGEKGCGKTTLLTRFLLLGAELICDDNILYDIRSGCIHPYISPVRVKGAIGELIQEERFEETFKVIEDNAEIVHLKCKNVALGGKFIDCVVIPTKEDAISVNEVSEKELFDVLIRNVKNSGCLKKKSLMQEVIKLLKKPTKRINTRCVNALDVNL